MRYNLVKRTPNTLLDDFFNDDFFFPRIDYSTNIDVYQKDEDYFVEVDLPGYKKEEISVDFSDDVLTIKAQHNEEEESKEKKYYYRTRKCSEFMRQIRFSNIDHENIDAQFNDGVLAIKLPTKQKEEVVNRIEVK